MDHHDGTTPTPPDNLGWPNVFGASIFVLLAAYISHALGTRLEMPLIISGVRCALQLTLMGLVLDDVLRVDNGYVITIITASIDDWDPIAEQWCNEYLVCWVHAE
ncbi:upf0014-domain-containing protein [Lichtheimia corymbifera JMRC:FSU:9682]|uniref:Upf0014-domain-containing protein n=1 Tax=Lichtheimia corymbifera JMRC:FSU:9682 TaxID=1263082 RepID=A0A068RZN0_9FUNG|nr:upf0014-domain-containing protein [Lichtheimia corymbifera JMRC:FSU:9682]